MEAPTKRNASMDWLFGNRLTGDELAIHLAARPPRWVSNSRQALRLVILAVLSVSLFDREGRVPIIGPWIAQTLAEYLIAIGCMLLIAASEWFDERRVAAIRKQRQTAGWPQT